MTFAELILGLAVFCVAIVVVLMVAAFRDEKKHMTDTMHDLYSDGSDHSVCSKCDMCVDCGDCKSEWGCGNNEGNGG